MHVPAARYRSVRVASARRSVPAIVRKRVHRSPQLRHHRFPPGPNMSREQAIHDRVNLYRLVRRLEKSVAEEGWHNPGDLKGSEPFPHAIWIRTQGTLAVSPFLCPLSLQNCWRPVADFGLQKIKHAKSLLKTVELENQIQLRL
jgi:hypothetical protein